MDDFGEEGELDENLGSRGPVVQITQLGDCFLLVSIVNSFTLETQAQGWDLNPDPESLWAACLHFPEIEPPQAASKNDDQNGKASQTK
ncbi:hypothetical protein DSO57_1024317 [Entomophthora muscae]|uniref:Uncharacterized protein n=1 Tax=Entomophthora muscae TaxID=34485 RepID=A0ACC2U1B7_9FUNG|nr:hypothetical protein DSO57_1024317 [Entomophthora muscae]